MKSDRVHAEKTTMLIKISFEASGKCIATEYRLLCKSLSRSNLAWRGRDSTLLCSTGVRADGSLEGCAFCSLLTLSSCIFICVIQMLLTINLETPYSKKPFSQIQLLQRTTASTIVAPDLPPAADKSDTA